MPFQIGKCEGCGHTDHLEFVWAWPEGAWLCRYCRETLEDEGEIELEDGRVIRRGSVFVVMVRTKKEVAKEELPEVIYRALMKAGMSPKEVIVKSAEFCPECGGPVIELEGGMGDALKYCLECGRRF